MKIALTGVAGYVGHQVAARLARAGFDVVGSTRRPFALAGVTIVTGDHLDEGFVAALVARADVVLHFAARTRGHSPAAFRRDNEDLTALISRATRRLGRRLIHVSSDQAVYQTGPYGRSKRACEEIVAREAGNHCVVRLSAVLGRYAPEMESTFSRIIRHLNEKRFLPVPGGGDFAIAPVWIGDIERALTALLARPRLPDDVFELCGPVVTLRHLLDLFELRLGVRRRRVRIPLAPLRGAARIARRLPILARLPLDALLDLGSPIRVSSERLEQLTGLVPTATDAAVAGIEDFPERGRRART